MTETQKDFYEFLAQIDKTFSEIPKDLKLKVSNLSQNLPMNMGQRLAKKAGVGVDILGLRAFDEKRDSPRAISWRHSMRGDSQMVIERELERRHRVYLWRDPNMPKEEREASEISMMALGKKLNGDEDRINIIKGQEMHRYRRANISTTTISTDVDIIASQELAIDVKVPKCSTVVLWGKFFDKEATEKNLAHLQGKQLQGYLVMMLSPAEADFDLPDNVRLVGSNGEKTLSDTSEIYFSDRKSFESKWFGALNEHLNWLQTSCSKVGCTLIVQRTDQPLETSLIKVLNNNTNDQKEDFKLALPKLEEN